MWPIIFKVEANKRLFIDFFDEKKIEFLADER